MRVRTGQRDNGRCLIELAVGHTILNAKTNTTLTMDDAVLAQARQAAAAEGRTLSAWTERAVRAELMRASAATAAQWEPRTRCCPRCSLPVVADAPRMPALAVVLSAEDPLPGWSVVVYQAKPVYRPWLVERIGSVTEAVARSAQRHGGGWPSQNTNAPAR